MGLIANEDANRELPYYSRGRRLVYEWRDAMCNPLATELRQLLSHFEADLVTEHLETAVTSDQLDETLERATAQYGELFDALPIDGNVGACRRILEHVGAVLAAEMAGPSDVALTNPLSATPLVLRITNQWTSLLPRMTMSVMRALIQLALPRGLVGEVIVIDYVRDDAYVLRINAAARDIIVEALELVVSVVRYYTTNVEYVGDSGLDDMRAALSTGVVFARLLIVATHERGYSGEHDALMDSLTDPVIRYRPYNSDEYAALVATIRSLSSRDEYLLSLEQSMGEWDRRVALVKTLSAKHHSLVMRTDLVHSGCKDCIGGGVGNMLSGVAIGDDRVGDVVLRTAVRRDKIDAPLSRIVARLDVGVDVPYARSRERWTLAHGMVPGEMGPGPPLRVGVWARVSEDYQHVLRTLARRPKWTGVTRVPPGEYGALEPLQRLLVAALAFENPLGDVRVHGVPDHKQPPTYRTTETATVLLSSLDTRGTEAVLRSTHTPFTYVGERIVPERRAGHKLDVLAHEYFDRVLQLLQVLQLSLQQLASPPLRIERTGDPVNEPVAMLAYVLSRSALAAGPFRSAEYHAWAAQLVTAQSYVVVARRNLANFLALGSA